MSSGRKKGTKLSEKHKESLRAALKGNTPWNKGMKAVKPPKLELSAEESKARIDSRMAKIACSRRKNTIQKYLDAAADLNWSNAAFSIENGRDYLSMTHSCGENLKIQVQTVRKWNFGDGLCKKCNPVFKGTSKAEQELIDFVRSIAPDAVSHQRLGPYELDIFVPSRNLAIEYDGLYWHSERAGYPNDKHLVKTENCNTAGFQLIHVFEDEFMQQRPIVESRIRSLLGNNTKIHARTLVLDCDVPVSEARAFLDRTHLQGYIGSTVKLGLRRDHELLAVMTFGKPRFSKAYNWELLRFSSELNSTVAGAASKLMAAFRRMHPGSIVSYADRRWSTGAVYRALGFKLVGESAPAYHYFKGDMRQNRQTFQKARLKVLMPEIFDENKTEAEMMFAAGWNRIWDCGNLVFELR